MHIGIHHYIWPVEQKTQMNGATQHTPGSHSGWGLIPLQDWLVLLAANALFHVS